MDNYYDDIADGYNRLHGDEQRKKIDTIKKYLRPRKRDLLLDVGCGTGISSDWDCRVIGIDPSMNLLKKNKGVSIKGVAESLPFPANTFNIVTCITAIQNFFDLEKGLSEINRVAKYQIIISFLKNSKKRGVFVDTIKKYFRVTDFIEDEKDIIYFLRK